MRKPFSRLNCPPYTNEYGKAQSLGRALLTLVHLGTNNPVLIGTVYGWATDKEGWG